MGTLRLGLALMVACAHITSLTPYVPASLGVHAEFAVRAFFIISGFFMAMIIHDRYALRRPTDFYVSRALKLLPLYWVIGIIIVTTQVLLFDRPEFSFFTSQQTYWRRLHFGELPWPNISYITTAVVSLVGVDTGLWLSFDPTGGQLYVGPEPSDAVSVMNLVPIPQAWTLGIEVLFYAIAPFVVRRSVAAIAGLLALSLAFRWTAAQLGLDGWPWNRALFPSELAFFLTGVLSYQALRRMKPDQTLIVRASFACICAFLLLRVVASSAAPSTPLMSLADLASYGVLAIGMPFIYLASRNSRFDGYLGDLSYPTYLVHMAVLAFLLVLPKHGWLWFALVLLTTLLIAAALHWAVARPIEQVRIRFGARARSAEPIGKYHTLANRAPQPQSR
jgi:peptidoglycan/LPS O-acetylase OafA/YrhL